jgi:hypothetical protein
MLNHSSNNLTVARPTKSVDVVVSDLALQSKFFLQDAHSHRFFQGIERWTIDPTRALVFYDVQEALYICRWLGLNDVRIVSDLDHNDNADALSWVA